ncbi:unnamed protein product [Aphanomyces euteiches]
MRHGSHTPPHSQTDSKESQGIPTDNQPSIRSCGSRLPQPTWRIVTAFRALVPGVTVQNTTIKVYSIELWKGDELAAGELGYCNGAMFTSLTGFVSPGASGAGTMQLYALGALLHVCQFQLWDLGMAMAYKTALGAYPMARIDFVQRVHTLRNIPVTLIEDERQAKDIIEQHLHL